jgi:hypothetical protein
MGDQVAPLPEGVPLYIVVVGRKGTGKTELAWQLWESWDGDRVLVDFTADVGKDHPDPHTHDLEDVPSRWPEHLKEDDETRLSLRYVPDTGDPYWRDEVDRLLGLCYSQGNVLIWIDDAGQCLAVGKVGPNGQRILQFGRHQDIWLLLTMPRPKTIETLALSQADVIYCFDLPSRFDRQRVADNVGWDTRDVDQANSELADHGYMRAHVAAHELAIFPPLPPSKIVHKTKRRHATTHFEDVDPRQTQ